MNEDATKNSASRTSNASPDPAPDESSVEDEDNEA